jgi:ketosteroid isomerase-like protein
MLGPDVGLATFVWYADAAWEGTDYKIRCPTTLVARRDDAGGWRILVIHSVPMEDRSAAR